MRFLGPIFLIATILTTSNAMASPKEDVEEVVNVMLSFGTKMLEAHGEFLPYGGAMTTSREVISVAGHIGKEQPLPQEAIELLSTSLRHAADKGKYIATGLFYDVRVAPPNSAIKTDAIAV